MCGNTRICISRIPKIDFTPNLSDRKFMKFSHCANHFSRDENPWSEADIARSLLYLVSNDIGQISTLYAMLHQIKRIYFGGFFLRHHPVGLHTISYAVNFWSKGQVSAYFLRHEGYLGAIGAFIKGAANTYQTDL